MACVNCDKIRAAILHGKMAEAAGISLDALREKFGLKVAHDDVTVEGLRSSVSIDAGADHRKDLDNGERGTEAFIPLNPARPVKRKN